MTPRLLRPSSSGAWSAGAFAGFRLPRALPLFGPTFRGEGVIRSDDVRSDYIIERQVAHLTRLVDDLLDVARVTRGKTELKKARVEMGSIVARAIEIASPLIEQRSHHLAVDVPASRLPVHGDPTRLAQIGSNLVTNAAKYTDAGGHITVRAKADDDSITPVRARRRHRDRARGVEAGFDAHIVKPIDLRALAKTIEAMRPC